MRAVSLVLLLHFFVILTSTGAYGQPSAQEWKVFLHRPGKSPAMIAHTTDPWRQTRFSKTIDGMTVEGGFTAAGNQIRFQFSATSKKTDSCYLTLQAQYNTGAAYTYLGEQLTEEVYRQSPHNPRDESFIEIKMQDVPMLAVKDKDGFVIAVNDSPVFYDNYTTQHINPLSKQVSISSGDDGRTIEPLPARLNVRPYYHEINKKKPHTFNGIIFKSKAATLNNLRKDVMKAIAERWNNTGNRLAATSWASNYMLLRKNETAYSDYWVVAGIKYSHKQFTRDAFWQSFVLPAFYDAECYKHEARSQSQGAERPLFTLIWAYRTKLNGGTPDMDAARKSLAYIDQHIRDNKFYSNNNPLRLNFQYWMDVVAFDAYDVVTCNQGLMPVALMAAEKLGLKPKASTEAAIRNYQGMFNKEKGYFPISEKKDLLAVDVLMGDLLAQLLFDKPLLSKESVTAHFNTIVKNAKTKYGYKTVSSPNGDYAPAEAYNAGDFKVDVGLGEGNGAYQAGGSWYLYDMLFLLDSYLHKVPGAKEELLWRGSLDFELGGTYFEHTNTVTGIPNKPNQGWCAAVYAIWKKLMDKGLADSSLLDAVDKIDN